MSDNFDALLTSLFGGPTDADIARGIKRADTITRRKPLKHSDDSPMITVLRLEDRDNPYRGAFASDQMFSNDDALIWPAEQWAIDHHGPRPGDLPNIMEDGRSMAAHWTVKHYAGWRDLAQADMWLPVPEMRRAVYERRNACVREYQIAKDRVLFGKHQVGFLLDFAKPLRHLSMEEFVRDA